MKLAILPVAAICVGCSADVLSEDELRDETQRLVEQYYEDIEASYEELRATAEELYGLGVESGDQDLQARGLVRVAYTEFYSGTWGNDCTAKLRQSEALCQKEPSLARAEFLMFSGHIEGKWLGDIDEGIERLKDAIWIANGLGADELQAQALFRCAELHIFANRLALARLYALRSLSIADSLGQRRTQVRSLFRVTQALLLGHGTSSAAAPYARRLQKLGSDSPLIVQALKQADGKPEAFEARLLQRIQSGAKGDPPFSHASEFADLQYTLARTYARQARFDEALVAARDALESYTDLQNKTQVAFTKFLIVELQVQRGDQGVDLGQLEGSVLVEGGPARSGLVKRLAAMYERFGDYESANRLLKALDRASTEELVQVSEQAVTAANDSWEAELSERALNRRIKDDQLRMERQEFLIYGTLALAVLGVALVLVVAKHKRVLALRDEIRAREQEERINSAVARSSGDGIICLDTEGRVTTFNPAAERLFGYSSSEMLGELITRIMTDEDTQAHAAGFQSFVRSGGVRANGDNYTLDVFGVSKTGKRVPVSMRVTMLADVEPPQVLGILRDMQPALELRQAQKMEAVGRLAGGIAHDMNNILTVVMGYTELLLGGAPEGPDANTLRGVLDAAGRGADVTHRLLAFSRKQPLQPEAIELAPLLESLMVLLSRTLGAHVELVASVADDLWLCNADKAQLEAALLNLSANARDAMSTGGQLFFKAANVHLEDEEAADLELSSGDYVCVAAIDTGEGMSEQVIQRAFDPFYTTKASGKGTGLGLSMVHGFVKQSGGGIAIASGAGGTTVRLYLPRVVVDEVVEAPPLVVDAPVSEQAEVILVVEDEDGVRLLLERQLEVLGYEVIVTANAADAMEVLRSSRQVDLLMTDIGLPGGIDGAELAEMAAMTRPELGRLFMSGYSGEPFTRAANRSDGALLQKPFTIAQAREAIGEALRSRRAGGPLGRADTH